MESEFRYHRKVLLIPVLAVVIIWFIFYLEIRFGLNFNRYGVYPKTLSGLRGIVFSPFIHSNANHLVNNSVPLAVMLGALFYFYDRIAFKVLIGGALLTGFLTWTFARPSFHIGASGVVFLLVSYISFSGIFRKYYRLIALSLTVVFLYGSMIWYIFPIKERISWEGHLSGFLIGLLFAFIFRRQGPQPKPFEFTENEEFDKLFDEEGNFVPPEDKETDGDR
jgi:membrane associated rhomboid family serine protease